MLRLTLTSLRLVRNPRTSCRSARTPMGAAWATWGWRLEYHADAPAEISSTVELPSSEPEPAETGPESEEEE
eukprot:1827894-Alexandrium_andersonii.AAC.1